MKKYILGNNLVETKHSWRADFHPLSPLICCEFLQLLKVEPNHGLISEDYTTGWRPLCVHFTQSFLCDCSEFDALILPQFCDHDGIVRIILHRLDACTHHSMKMETLSDPRSFVMAYCNGNVYTGMDASCMFLCACVCARAAPVGIDRAALIEWKMMFADTDMDLCADTDSLRRQNNANRMREIQHPKTQKACKNRLFSSQSWTGIFTAISLFLAFMKCTQHQMLCRDLHGMIRSVSHIHLKLDFTNLIVLYFMVPGKADHLVILVPTSFSGVHPS
jgi:hypothetical protein